MTRRWTKTSNAVILSVIHNRENPLLSTSKGGLSVAVISETYGLGKDMTVWISDI
jgi:hypothetical protein